MQFESIIIHNIILTHDKRGNESFDLITLCEYSIYIYMNSHNAVLYVS